MTIKQEEDIYMFYEWAGAHDWPLAYRLKENWPLFHRSWNIVDAYIQPKEYGAVFFKSKDKEGKEVFYRNLTEISEESYTTNTENVKTKQEKV